MSAPELEPRTEAFYGDVLTAADRAALAAAHGVPGVDGEIALLRLEIRRLLEAQSPDPRVLQGAMRLLVQMLAAQHRLSGEATDRFGDSVARAVEGFAAMFSTPGEEARGE